MAERTVDVAVVGGGITGLAAAHVLAARGLDYVVLEAGPSFGGVIRTDAAGGFLIEGGPDTILTQKPEAVSLCRELGLGDRLVPTNPKERAVFVLHRGRLHPLPDGMMLAVPTRVLPVLKSRLFSWPGKLRMGLEPFVPARRETGDESIASFLRRRLGQEVVDRLGEPLLAGIHSGDPERLSMRATFPRFVEMEKRRGSLVLAMLKAPRPAPGQDASAFVSLEGGLRELVDALVGRLPAERLRARTRVSRLVPQPGGFRVEAEGEAWQARAVVMAAPAPAAAPLLEPVRPAAAEILRAIPFLSTVTVALGFRREDVSHPLDGYGFVVPRTEGLRTSAGSFVSTKFPGRAPEGHVLLRAFLGGTRDPAVLEETDEGLVALARAELGRVVGLRGEPVIARVYRWPRGTPQMEVGHEDRIAALQGDLDALPGLFLAGAGLRGTGLPDCVADGSARAREAAESVTRPQP